MSTSSDEISRRVAALITATDELAAAMADAAMAGELQFDVRHHTLFDEQLGRFGPRYAGHKMANEI